MGVLGSLHKTLSGMGLNYGIQQRLCNHLMHDRQTKGQWLGLDRWLLPTSWQTTEIESRGPLHCSKFERLDDSIAIFVESLCRLGVTILWQGELVFSGKAKRWHRATREYA